MRMLIATALIIPTAAYATARPEPIAPVGMDFECDYAALEPFVGQAATSELAAQMLAASGARSVRWVPKGGVVTMDFRPDRLTIQLDETNRIVSARCN